MIESLCDREGERISATDSVVGVECFDFPFGKVVVAESTPVDELHFLLSVLVILQIELYFPLIFFHLYLQALHCDLQYRVDHFERSQEHFTV